MTKTQYVEKKFQGKSLDKIKKANEIIEEYQNKGFSLTLRQIYYQFVARGWSENTLRAYKALGTVISDGRMAGLIDWNAIEDRTRSLRGLGADFSPSATIRAAARTYRRDLWENQPERFEVWIEKDALVGVIQRPCHSLDVDYFALRGYASHSSLHRAAQRIKKYISEDQKVTILHMGDHDPEGIDITRDIEDKMATFGVEVEVVRIALNMDQVQQYNPPPAPVKLTSSRAGEYISDHGQEVWELDALEPEVMGQLIRDHIEPRINQELLQELNERTDNEKSQMQQIASNFHEVLQFLNDWDADPYGENSE